MANDATLIRALSHPGDETRREATHVLHGAVHDHYRQLRLVDRQGRVIAEAGEPAHPEMTLILPNQAGKLIYAGSMLVAVETPVTSSGVRVGTLTATARLPELDNMLRNPDSVGRL